MITIAYVSRMIPVVGIIPAASEHRTPVGGEQDNDGQQKHENFHIPDPATH